MPALPHRALGPRGGARGEERHASGTSRYPGGGHATRSSSWPPRARRRCSATPRWPCTPTTRATRDLHRQEGGAAARRIARSPSSPTPSWSDMAFGTGAVKVTPAHDFNDYETGQAPQPSEQIDIFDETGAHERAGRRLRRARSLRGAQAGARRPRGARAAGEDRAAQALRRASASAADTVVEPHAQLPVVREDRAAGQAGHRGGGDRARPGSCPRAGRNTYFSWMRNIHDWCISRQLWWGHQIPAWYCDDGHVDSWPATEPTACARMRPRATRSATTTCSTPGSARGSGRSRRWAGPSKTDGAARLLPDSVMETGTTSSSSGSPG